MSKLQRKDSKILPAEGWQRYLRISYTPALRDKLLPAIEFVFSKIGFEGKLVEKNLNQMETSEPVVINDSNGNVFHLLLQKLPDSQAVPYLIFHTDDCLRDYHKYTAKGVEFLNRPEYRPEGLSANFVDNNDQVYTLLEERSYADAI